MSAAADSPRPADPAPVATGSPEDLAAAWGASLEQEAATDAAAAPGMAADAARVLNQAEIDSLLGFGMGPTREAEESGIQRIISSGLIISTATRGQIVNYINSCFV
jgi:hypothetical protein